MNLIVAGTREFADTLGLWIDCGGAKVVARALEHDTTPSPAEVDTIISGGAVGPDTWGEAYASAFEGVTADRYTPKWEQYEGRDKPAPYARNETMAEAGDELLAFWDGKSGGTRHMIEQAQKRGLTKHVVRMDDKQSRRALLKGDDVRPIINTYDPSPNQDLAKVAKTVSD